MAGDGQGRDTRRWRPSGAVLGIIRHLTGRLRKDAKCASDSMYVGAYHSCACVVLMQEWSTGVCWNPPCACALVAKRWLQGQASVARTAGMRGMWGACGGVEVPGA
jgi:hypothetical protein